MNSAMTSLGLSFFIGSRTMACAEEAESVFSNVSGDLQSQVSVSLSDAHGVAPSQASREGFALVDPNLLPGAKAINFYEEEQIA